MEAILIGYLLIGLVLFFLGTFLFARSWRMTFKEAYKETAGTFAIFALTWPFSVDLLLSHNGPGPKND